MPSADRSNPRVPSSRIIRKGQNVARYDDDYPLLYGEPAPQPQWDTGNAIPDQVMRQAEQQASDAASSRLSSGR
jgi:hypothetical protein